MRRLKQLLNQHLPCPLCATYYAASDAPLCPACLAALPWALDSNWRSGLPVLSVFEYHEPINALLLGGKNNPQLDQLHILARLIALYLPAVLPAVPDAILPIPLHTKRLRQRGFNQSLELARPLAKQLKIPLITQGVIRHRHTQEQKTLSGTERLHNLQDAFRLTAPLTHQHIALFDDMITTGSTCMELAALLHEHGIRVQIWTCARTK